MKTLIKILLLTFPLFSQAGTFENASYNVCFTPQQDCTSKIVNEINSAKHEILVQAYSFTSKPIIDALIKANNNHVTVMILLDKSQKKAATNLWQHGIWDKIDYKPSIAHNKIMIIDDATVITGSFNFTKAAQYKNAENVLIIHDKTLANIYKNNWQYRLQQSTKRGK